MKNFVSRLVGISVVTLASGFAAEPVAVRDAVKVAPEAFKVLLENERVRVVEARFGPGVKNPMHSHPDYVIYPLTSYTVRVEARDGTTKVIEVTAGSPRWSPAVTHADENVETTEARAVLIELKEPPK